jgi:hypothetical protein
VRYSSRTPQCWLAQERGSRAVLSPWLQVSQSNRRQLFTRYLYHNVISLPALPASPNPTPTVIRKHVSWHEADLFEKNVVYLRVWRVIGSVGAELSQACWYLFYIT